MAEFHVNFMLSSLLYAGSTIGWVVACLWPLWRGGKRWSHLAKRFLTGTLLVESIIKQLGGFSPTDGHWSWFPATSFLSVFTSAKNPRKIIGYSPSQSRLLVLLVSSCLHGMFFVMMGSEGGYWVSFCAYALAAFARSLLTGIIFLISISPH